MCNFIVTDEEIAKAEKDIFLGNGTFSDQQKSFLKCLDSCSLQSYAGSGKTSTLVGKLHILAQKRVWDTGRAICVISHTNIAVDEIKSRVAIHYPEIMEYPNFVGTIQEFVNKFLFVPYLSSVGMHIKFQDEKRYLDYENDGDAVLKTRITNRLSQLRRGGDGAVSSFWSEFHRLCIKDNKVINSKTFNEYNSLVTKSFTQIQSNSLIGTLINKQHQDGAFLFPESFIYALKYLEENPLLRKIIMNRFQFILLDEAQDCSEIQLNLLEQLFGKNVWTCFQQIGDINQSISEDAWLSPAPVLCLDKSIRCGSNLTNFLCNFCINTIDGKSIKGSSNVSEKILIIYPDNEPEKILEKFSEILLSKKIPCNENKGYFVIAHEHDQLLECFPNYYSQETAMSKKQNKSIRFSNDIDYVNLLTENSIKTNGNYYISNILFRLLYKHFKGNGTWFELKEKLINENDKFKKLILDVSNEVLKNGSILDFPELQKKLNEILGENVITFNKKKATIEEINNKSNFYKSPEGINLKIGTIHSVKGQTHNATLFMSNSKTIYRKYDIEHAMQNDQKVCTKKYKRLVYVASSRPKDLFAFGITKSAYNSITDKTCFNSFEEIKI